MIKKVMAFLILRDMIKKNPSGERDQASISKQGVLAAQAVRSMYESFKARNNWAVSLHTHSILETFKVCERDRINKQLQAFADLNDLKVPSTKRFDDTERGDEKKAD